MTHQEVLAALAKIDKALASIKRLLDVDDLTPNDHAWLVVRSDEASAKLAALVEQLEHAVYQES